VGASFGNDPNKIYAIRPEDDGKIWERQTLYRTRDGWFIEYESNYIVHHPCALRISAKDAFYWFSGKGYKLPAELRKIEEDFDLGIGCKDSDDDDDDDDEP